MGVGRNVKLHENHVKYSRPENVGESVKASLRTIKSMGAGN